MPATTSKRSDRRSPERAGHAALVVAAFFFGTTFLVVKDGTEDLSPAAFLALRFAVGAAVLVPLATGRGWRSVLPVPTGANGRHPIWSAGLLAGGALLSGYLFQTVGLQYTTSSNSAFITGLFVVFTPVFAAALLRRPPTGPTVVGAMLAAAGLFLVSGAGFRLGRGDALTVGAAVSFALHIVVVARFAHRFPPVRFTAVQLAVVAAGAAMAVPVTGVGRVTAAAAGAAVFCGVVASALAFSLMVFGQTRVGPTRSALTLALEPVFAGLLGYAAGERLGVAGAAGAVLILAGIVVAEVRRAPLSPG